MIEEWKRNHKWPCWCICQGHYLASSTPPGLLQCLYYTELASHLEIDCRTVRWCKIKTSNNFDFVTIDYSCYKCFYHWLPYTVKRSHSESLCMYGESPAIIVWDCLHMKILHFYVYSVIFNKMESQSKDFPSVRLGFGTCNLDCLKHSHLRLYLVSH